MDPAVSGGSAEGRDQVMESWERRRALCEKASFFDERTRIFSSMDAA